MLEELIREIFGSKEELASQLEEVLYSFIEQISADADPMVNKEAMMCLTTLIRTLHVSAGTK